jgi:hypothetical protein
MKEGVYILQVMAAAMAETGQIKLFGEKPTIAEATLARARKHVFYNERYLLCLLIRIDVSCSLKNSLDFVILL